MKTNKISKPERKKRIKEAFKALQASTDLTELKKIIVEMVVFELDPKRIVEDEFISSSILINLSPDQIAMIKNPPEVTEEETGQSESEDYNFDKHYLGMTADEQLDLAKDILDTEFIKGRPFTDSMRAGFTLYAIEDKDDRVCKAMSEDRNKRFEEMQAVAAKKLLTAGTTARPATARDIVDVWWLNTDIQEKVYNCTNTFLNPLDETKDWSLYHSKHTPNSSVPFPHLKATLDRMSEGDAFAALIWGTYTKQYKGRQVFYIWGKEGEEGKSYLAQFLGSELWGTNAGYSSISNVNISKTNQFTMSAYVGSDFIVYPDCNNTRFLQTEMVKVLSGGGRDASLTEKKFKDAQTVVLTARLVICSNYAPYVLRDNWYQSRLILSEIAPFTGAKDPEIDKKYREEMPGFLAYAKDCYERLCPTHEAIKTSIHNLALIEKLIDENDPSNREIFLGYFDLDENSRMEHRDIRAVLESADIKMNNKDFQEFLHYVEDHEGVEHIFAVGRNAVMKGIKRADKKKRAAIAKPLSAYEQDVADRKLMGLV